MGLTEKFCKYPIENVTLLGTKRKLYRLKIFYCKCLCMVCVCMCVCTCHRMCVCRSEDNSSQFFPSTLRVLRIEFATYVLVASTFILLSHPISPT